MLVGEAPGRQEDLQGEPFVGAAGRFFNEQLHVAGLSRTDVYLTNVVKSRPFIGPSPGRNRAPTAAEISACVPWLQEQLSIIKPSAVVTLGQIALDQFLPGRKLAEVHGRPVTRGALTVLPLYHPAMARYGQRWKRVLRKDFRQVGRLLLEAKAEGGRRKAAKE